MNHELGLVWCCGLKRSFTPHSRIHVIGYMESTVDYLLYYFSVLSNSS